MDRRAVLCAHCGKKVSEERVEELLVPTELAKGLLDHSKWMAVVLSQILQQLGVGLDRVILEFQEGTEEVDAFVDVEGSLVMIELKDKEFSIRQAHPLPGRIAMYHPKHVVIVTSDKIAPDVREYFDRIEPEAQLTYVEGVASLRPALDGIVDSIRTERTIAVLERFNPLTLGVDMRVHILEKIGLTVPPSVREDWARRTRGVRL